MKALPPTICPRKLLTRPDALIVGALVFGALLASAQDTPSKFIPPPFEVADGFEVSVAAAPPLVKYPMMACFDDRGRLYIAESDGRNLTTRAEIEKELPRFVRRLLDTDGDGVFDKSTIFADKMTMPEGGLWHDGALYIISPPYLWRLEDTNDDGVADKREKIIGSMNFDGRANQHGPYLGPNGRFYFTGGHFGYQFEGTDGSKTGTSRAAGVFSCRPDGSDVRIEGQGGINPVDLVFTRSGEMLSTCAIFDSFGGKRHDALIHWVPGGLTQRVYGLPLLRDTGYRLPAVIRWGQVAPAGLMRYRGTHFGPRHIDSLFACHFNTNKVVQVHLKKNDSTFTTEENDFLSSTSFDFRPADVLEDADGSLLVLDTGGWLSWGCPHSKTAKPEVLGAIYRIRRIGGKRLDDPRGLKLAWDKAESSELSIRLADPRPALRDRAQALLITRGEKATGSVVSHLENNKDPKVRQRCVSVLSQIDSKISQIAIRSALEDKDAGVRALAARSLGIMKDNHAVNYLIRLLSDEESAVRRAAATALGQIGDKSGIAPIFNALKPDTELLLQHALTLALIKIDNEVATALYLSDSKSPHHQRTALRVLDQRKSKLLIPSLVVPYFNSPHPALRDEARRIIVSRKDWKPEVLQLFQSLLEGNSLEGDAAQQLEEIALAFNQDGEFHKIVVQALAKEKTAVEIKSVLLASIAQMDSLPDSLQSALRTILQSSSNDMKAEAMRAIVRFDAYKSLAPEINRIAVDRKENSLLRLSAYEAIAQERKSLNAVELKFIEGVLRSTESSPLLHRQAARALSRVDLTTENPSQTKTCLELIAFASPYHLAPLLEPLERLDSKAWPENQFDALGVRFADALRVSPGRKGLAPDQLASLRSLFPENFPAAHAAFKELTKENSESAKERETKLAKLVLQSESGNASRGRILFYTNRATCSLCHRVNERGGSLGPNLSKIGEIRSRKDLLEAIVYPSATVVNGFESYALTIKDGASHMGLVQRETSDAIYLRGADQRVKRVPRNQIVGMVRSPVSTMPEGLDLVISKQDLADLIAFLETCR